jgi:hypothetical protein
MRYPRRWLLVGLLLALLLFPLPASSRGVELQVAVLPPVPQRDPFFGVVQASDDPARAVAAGVRWERRVVRWSSIQPDGPADWKPDPKFPREEIEAQRSRGIETVGVVLHTPVWAAEEGGYHPIQPPQNLDLNYDHEANHWGQFLMRLSAEYAGVVDTWILWNEPDLYDERASANWEGTVEEFARMQAVGYEAIKRGNPRARVLLAGTTFWWDNQYPRPHYLDRLLATLTAMPDAARNGAYFDAVSVHQYNSSLNSYAVPMVFRRIMAKYGLDKPLWMNESNAIPHDDPVGPLPREHQRVSLEEQANYVIQSIALARAAGVERYAIYKMLDEEPENQHYYGLIRNDGSPRPAYVAYQVAARELANVSNAQYFWSGSASPPTQDEITALLASPAHMMQFIWPGALNGVRMTRGADRVTVLWNASAAPLPVILPSSAPQAAVISKYGQQQTLARGADGTFRLTLAAATNNSDLRNRRIILVAGDPVIVVEPGAAGARDAYPRPQDACAGVAGALVPPNPTPAEGWLAPTGYAVSGPWLEFFRTHGDLDYVGYPRSPVVADPLDPRQCVQYFQRLVLEWHPNNPAGYRIQRRLLTAELGMGEIAPSLPAAGPNTDDYWYFPKGANGLGHAVSNVAPDGARIGFKAYFDRYGREDAFGYPMEPPVMRTGADGVARWTQRFQAAVFEYHAEFDREGEKPGTGVPWRNWTVQLRLLGDEYIESRPLPFIVGDPTQHVPVLPRPTPGG